MIVLMKSAFIVIGITNVILTRIIGIKNIEVEHKCQYTKKPHSDGVGFSLNFQAPSAGLEPATL